jgi:RNA polymerase sigma factor (sigma-70 family)
MAERWRALEACRDYLRLIARRGGWSRGVDPAATSDLVQGTIVDGWTQFSRFRGRTPRQLRAWLKAILIHAALNARRRPRTAPIGSGGSLRNVVDSARSPSSNARGKEEHETVDAALGRLSDRHRTVIRLRVWERISFVEVGARMELSEDAARILYARALAQLHQAMRSGHDPG